MKRFKDSQFCSIYACRMTTSKVSTFGGIKLYYQQMSEMPSNVILKGLYKSELQDSVQLQTVLALYDQETIRNNGQTSCLRLKTSVKLHVDQMMRTRNFRVRNDVVERGAHTKSSKGKKAYVERKVGEYFQWKAHGDCSKGYSRSFSHDKLVQGDLSGGQRRKGRSSSPAPNSKARTDGGGEKSSKTDHHRQKEQHSVPSQLFFKIRHVDSGILPYVITQTSLRPE